MAIMPEDLLDDPSSVAGLAAAATGLPPLGISSGPSMADGFNEGSSTGATGAFSFGEAPTGLAAVAQTAAPFLILAAVIWWTNRH